MQKSTAGNITERIGPASVTQTRKTLRKPKFPTLIIIVLRTIIFTPWCILKVRLASELFRILVANPEAIYPAREIEAQLRDEMRSSMEEMIQEAEWLKTFFSEEIEP